MAQMTERLAEDPELAEAYQAAHERYLADRTQIAAEQGTGPVAQIEGISAGGMPTRIKCLHALAAQALASKMKNARIVTVPSGHAMMGEKPDEVLDALAGFAKTAR